MVEHKVAICPGQGTRGPLGGKEVMLKSEGVQINQLQKRGKSLRMGLVVRPLRTSRLTGNSVFAAILRSKSEWKDEEG